MKKKNHQSPAMEIVEIESTELLAGSNPDGFIDEIYDDILIESPEDIL